MVRTEMRLHGRDVELVGGKGVRAIFEVVSTLGLRVAADLAPIVDGGETTLVRGGRDDRDSESPAVRALVDLPQHQLIRPHGAQWKIQAASAKVAGVGVAVHAVDS